MIDVLITGGVGVISSIVSGACSYLFAKRRYNAEVDGNVIENMKQSLEFYKAVCDDNKERLEELQKRNDDLQERDVKLEKEMSHLKSQMISLMGQICIDLTCAKRVAMTREEVNCRFID